MPRDEYDDEDDLGPPRRRPARRDDYDDRDDDRPVPKKKGGTNVLLIVGIVLGSLFLVCGGAGAAVYFLAIKPAAAKVREANDRMQAEIAERQKQIEKERLQAEQAGKVWGLLELKDAVFRMTPAQVRDLLGPPDQTEGNPDKDTAAALVYRNRVKGPTGQPAPVAVRFAKGIAIGAETRGPGLPVAPIVP